MSGPHVALDHVFVPILIAWAVADWLWIYPRLVRAIAAGVVGARKRLYWSILAAEWLITAGILALWVAQKRPWNELFLGSATPWRLGVGMALAVLLVGLLLMQRRAILAKPELLQMVRRKLAHGEPLLPHVADERALFAALAMTAGVCEELIFRGFVMWYFWVWTGPILALVISSAIFGFGHIYLGAAQVPKTGGVGMLLAGIVLLSGSLWPAMIMHAAIDWNSGDLGFHAFGQGRSMAAATAMSGEAGQAE